MMDADGLNHEQCGPYAYTSCSLNSASLVGQIVLRINTWMARNQFDLANDLITNGTSSWYDAEWYYSCSFDVPANLPC